MKKLFFTGLLSACTLLLISCLESGSNMQSRNGVPGIIKIDESKKATIMSPDFYPYAFYDPSISLENMEFEDGDCILFGYTVDFNETSNADYQVTGVIQGSISSGIVALDQYPCLPDIYYPNIYPDIDLDTSTLMPNEQPIAYAISTVGMTSYFLDKFFLSSDFTTNTDQKTFWYLYYDPNLPTKEVDGKTVYTLFLRAEITDPGKKPVINGYATNVFDTESFIGTITNYEKIKGNQMAYFQINHINEIKSDGTFTWSQSEVLSFTIDE
ncbi:MAG: hypothetical protein LBD89_09765 [Tannerellaceae bacterium]|jgi:hypothetical protein|nr:hypothetical protein [Tannerellaceae bacterium]